MLAKSPFPRSKEWVMTQYEDFGDTWFTKLANLETIHYFASFFSEHGELGVAILAYLNSFAYSPKKTLDNYYCDVFPSKDTIKTARMLLERYYGTYPTRKDFIKRQLRLMGEEFPRKNSQRRDVEKIRFDGSYFSLTPNGAVHGFNIFDQHAK